MAVAEGELIPAAFAEQPLVEIDSLEPPLGELPAVIAISEFLHPLRSNTELLRGLSGPVLGQSQLLLETGADTPADAYTRYHDPATGEVHVQSRLTLEDYEEITPPDVWRRLLEYGRENKGRNVIRINATPYGGGVAIMNESWVHIMRLLEVDAHWYALDEDLQGSQVTKFRFHNGMQNVAPREEITLTEKDKEAYESWLDRNAQILEVPMRQADLIIIDDAQPSRLIRYIKGQPDPEYDGPEPSEGWNPNAPVIYRDHIHSEGQLMVTPGTPQYDIWQYLWDNNGISQADVFVIHPVDEFAPPNVPRERIVKMPATADKLGDLLRDLSDGEIESGFDFINDQLRANEQQGPIDRDRPYAALVARFDESKGMPQGMESYLEARKIMDELGTPTADIPQLVIIGNGAMDDPSGEKELAKVMALRNSEEYQAIKNDIKIARVPHNDTAINAVLRGAKLALQPSTKEGFESRVTDAILLGVPVIGSDRGGIPLQIKHRVGEEGKIVGESGLVIDPYDTREWGKQIAELMTDQNAYRMLKVLTARRAKQHNEQFTTVQNELNWNYLISTMLALDRDNFQGNGRWVSDLAIEESSFSI